METCERTIRLRLTLDDEEACGTGEVTAIFSYASDDPYAVRASFDGGPVWVFAREILSAGLLAPAGIGDVRAWPSTLDGVEGDAITLFLASPDGQAFLTAKQFDVRKFLEATLALVAEGEESEFLDIDAGLNVLLSQREKWGL